MNSNEVCFLMTDCKQLSHIPLVCAVNKQVELPFSLCMRSSILHKDCFIFQLKAKRRQGSRYPRARRGFRMVRHDQYFRWCNTAALRHRSSARHVSASLSPSLSQSSEASGTSSSTTLSGSRSSSPECGTLSDKHSRCALKVRKDCHRQLCSSH